MVPACPEAPVGVAQTVVLAEAAPERGAEATVAEVTSQLGARAVVVEAPEGPVSRHRASTRVMAEVVQAY